MPAMIRFGAQTLKGFLVELIPFVSAYFTTLICIQIMWSVDILEVYLPCGVMFFIVWS